MTANEIMNPKPTILKPEDTVKSIMELFRTSPTSGYVVVSPAGVVVGVIGQNDLFTSGLGLHIPSYIQLLQESHFDKKSSKELPYAANQLVAATAKDVMNQSVFFAHPDTQLEVIAAALSTGKQAVVPVVTQDNKFLGAITAEQVFAIVANNTPPPQLNLNHPARPVDNELSYVRKDLGSKFSYIARSRAHLWLSMTLILFIIGFSLGIIFIVDPQPISDSVGNNIHELLDKIF